MERRGINKNIKTEGSIPGIFSHFFFSKENKINNAYFATILINELGISYQRINHTYNNNNINILFGIIY